MKQIYFLHILLWLVFSSLAYPNWLGNKRLCCCIWFDKMTRNSWIGFFFLEQAKESCVTIEDRRICYLHHQTPLPGKLRTSTPQKMRETIDSASSLSSDQGRSLRLQLHTTKWPALYSPHHQSHSRIKSNSVEYTAVPMLPDFPSD